LDGRGAEVVAQFQGNRWKYCLKILELFRWLRGREPRNFMLAHAATRGRKLLGLAREGFGETIAEGRAEFSLSLGITEERVIKRLAVVQNQIFVPSLQLQ
jgi:hypothetical protein